MQKKTIYILAASAVAAVIIIVSIAAIQKIGSDATPTADETYKQSAPAAEAYNNQTPAQPTPSKPEIIADYGPALQQARDANDEAKIQQLVAERNARLKESEKQRIDQLRQSTPPQVRPFRGLRR